MEYGPKEGELGTRCDASVQVGVTRVGTNTVKYITNGGDQCETRKQKKARTRFSLPMWKTVYGEAYSH